MKTNATPQNFQAYFFGAAQRRFSLLPPIRCAGFLMGKRHRVTRMFTTCSFSFILSGRGTYLHRGRTLRVVAPCLLLEWPGEAMDYGPDDSWDETFISYPADLIGTFCRSGFMDLDEPVRPIPDPESVRAQSERLHRFLQQSAPDPDSTDACCYALLLASRTSASVNAAKAPPRITRLEQQLAESIGSPIDCAALAKEFSMSLTSLRRYWRRYHGRETFKDFRDAVFKNRACRLLVETDRTIGDIASELKFADPFYFSRKFTALIGVPPSEYRRANRIGV